MDSVKRLFELLSCRDLVTAARDKDQEEDPPVLDTLASIT